MKIPTFPIIYVIVLICLFQTSKCYKVLMIFSCPARSHYILGSALAKGLLKSGFHVTMISGYGEKTSHENYTDVVVEELVKSHAESLGHFLFRSQHVSPWLQMSTLSAIGKTYTETILFNSKVQKLLNSNATFDAVIIEQFLNDGLKYFAYHYQVPLIVLSTIGANRWVNIYTGNPAPPSYVPEMRLGYKSPMTFMECSYNFVFGIVQDLFLHFGVYSTQESLLKKYIPNSPDLEDFLYNVSLVLLNSHESLNQAVPMVPNMINVGGFHINPPKELPRDLKASIDSAREGVIYFSMGSNLLLSSMPEAQKEAIIKVLVARKERVLWKSDIENIPGQSKNILTSKWYPQQDILAHKNIKLFITHCGLLSILEAIYNAVPVLCLPTFGDQMLNGNQVTQLEIGKSIEFLSLNQENFGQAVDEILDNTQYKTNAEYRSKLFHDRPMGPLHLAIYWIKYVIEHKGAPHLRVAGASLPWYRYLMLDVVLALVVSVFTAVYVVFKLVQCFLKRGNSKLKQN